MATQLDKVQEVKKRVTIPMYFYNIILPQMSDYYSDYTVDFDVKATAKCCLHDEDTPSLRYYEETNTFFCFGCRAGGDVIQLHRKFTEKMNGEVVTFDGSVTFLYDYFIKGVEQKVAVVKADKTEYKSELHEVMRFSSYCKTLEGQLMADSSIEESNKINILNELDKVATLVSLNEVNARDALGYMKVVTRKNIT